MMTLGGALGPFLFGYMAKKFGKRRALQSMGLPLTISYIALAFGNYVEIFYVARFFIGLAVAGAFSVGINYVIELTNKSNRGIVGTCTSIAANFGMLFSYCLGPYLNIMAFNLVLAGIGCTFLVAFSLVGSECPIYHLNRENEAKAREVIEMKQG